MRMTTWGTRRVLTALTLLALAALTVAAGGSAAPTPEGADSTGLIGPEWTPVGLRDGATTVILQLSGDPVTVAQSTAGRKLDKSEKQALKSQLKGKQDGLRPDIDRLGGTVLADYQLAYNGIKVRIDRNKVSDLGIASEDYGLANRKSARRKLPPLTDS